MQCTPRFFREALPQWKREKDSFLVKHVYRPLSFYVASFFCRVGFTANMVSMLSAVVALLAAGCFLMRCGTWYIVGAILLNVWMLLDCADGNIARAVKSELYGEFVDAVSSYLLIGILFICLGVAAYHTDGLFLMRGCYWLIFAGAVASNSDSMARLFYQKYLNQETFHKQEGHFGKKGQEPRQDVSNLLKIQDRIDKEMGANGIFLPLILFCAIVGWFDFFVIIYAFFYGLKCVATLLVLMHKTIKQNA